MKMATFKRTTQEVEELADKIDIQFRQSISSFGPSKYPGMTYEQGVEETILWLLDEHAEPPSVE
jgi:hypothetical protein